MTPPRIVSLVPAGTDMVADLGLGSALVGVSHQCDHPAAARSPVVTASNIPAVGSHGPGHPTPAEVDGAVTEAVRAGQPLYRTDTALLEELRPDIVVVQDLCDVCAVTGADLGPDLPADAELVSLEGTTLSGLEEDVRRLAKAAGVEDRAGPLLSRLRSRLARLAERLAGRPTRRAVVVEWGDPPYVAGHWVPELVAVAGGVHLLVGAGQRSRRATWEEVSGSAPDAVVFGPCGYTLAEAEAEVTALGLTDRLPPTTELWAVDATALFSRCTPRSVAAAAEVLAGILHPGAAPAPPPSVAARLA